VIHVIDKVLVPPGVLNIVQMAQLNADFSTLLTAVSATTDLVGELSGSVNYTVFAPTNAAFDALPAGTVSTLLENPDGQLRNILLFHVLAGSVRAADVVALAKPATVPTALTDASFTVTADLQITEAFDGPASLLATDVIASNGVIHVIDRVLNPGA
jgi:transforming growth factor-beta-induced protein